MVMMLLQDELYGPTKLRCWAVWDHSSNLWVEFESLVRIVPSSQTFFRIADSVQEKIIEISRNLINRELTNL